MYNFDKITKRESTANIKYDLRHKFFDTKDVIPMWVADMDFETPEFVRKAVIERAEHPIYGYSFREDSYAESIVDWTKRRHGWDIQKEWIVFSPGIVPALNFSTMAYTKPGDSILVQPPVYFPFFTAATDHDRVLVENELVLKEGKYVINFEDFEEKAKSAKMFFFSSPHNPVGRVWTEDELRKIGEICVKNNVLIISDEIHNDLILPGIKHIPIASLSDEIANNTITCIAPSKTFNLAGLATSSVIISNKDLRQRFEKVINSLHLTLGNLFGSIASTAGYTHGDQWVDELMSYISGNIDIVRNKLKESGSGIKLIEPESTYLIWLDFRNLHLKDEEIDEILIK